MPVNPRFGALAAIMLLALPCMAQGAKGLTWKMAFLKGDLVNAASQDLAKPIEMENGGKFRLYLELAESRAFLYVLYRGADASFATLANGQITGPGGLFLPSEMETFTVTPPSGTETIYVVLTKDRQSGLEKLLSKKKKDANAIVEEVKRIQRSTAESTEIPQKPVPIGGAYRGEAESMQASQFEGRETYVNILRLKH